MTQSKTRFCRSLKHLDHDEKHPFCLDAERWRGLTEERYAKKRDQVIDEYRTEILILFTWLHDPDMSP